LWARYEGFIDVKPQDKNLDIIEVHLDDPINKNSSDLNPSLSSDKQPTSLTAPSAPTAEEWAFASKYTLKNSKGYRHSFGQQVRSMMGTAVEGPDQGQVRFRIEIAPSGSITKVETLWKTSDKAEQLARKAISSMPALPPTPTGKPLIFERTISFTPYATNDVPIYRDDCQPDAPAFNNPFAWDGKSPQEIKQTKPSEKLSAEALAECLKQLPQDSTEGVAAHNQRQFEQWRSGRLNQQQ
jgi:TonB family protein